MSGGVPRDRKLKRQRRLRATAAARSRQLAVLIDKARARAAAALAPDPEAAQAHRAQATLTSRISAADAGEPVIITRRDTDAQIEIRQVAPDRGSGPRMAVECLTHHEGPQYTDTVKRATDVARRSELWCPGCEDLLLVNPKVRDRARAGARGG